MITELTKDEKVVWTQLFNKKYAKWRKMRGKEVKVKTKTYVISGELQVVGKNHIQLFRYVHDTPIIDYSEILKIEEVDEK